MKEDINIEVRLYDASQKYAWDAFIDSSKNGTFLLKRDYMDYHSDRFADMSLMVYRKDKLFALLPGNHNGDRFWSHQGLTYGGLVTNSKMDASECIEVIRAINEFLKAHGIKCVTYKPTPYIYHKIPAQEDLYALYVTVEPRLASRCISSTIYESSRIKFIESRKSGIRKAKKASIRIEESDEIEKFWNILNDNLQANHATKPVHTSDELILLKNRFPQNIKLYVARNADGEIIGGTLIYITDLVVHTQYISATDEGKYAGALDLLFDYLINERFTNYPYFDFGHSTENGGKYLNEALIFQKEGFGGRGVCYDIYEYDL